MAVEPQPADREVVLSVRGLRVVYPSPGGDVVAVDDFSLDLHQGEVVGLVGESGCGKSTAALAILGLVRGSGRIDAGTVTFDGSDLRDLDEKELRRIRGARIGLVVQNPRAALNPMLPIGRQLANVYLAHHDADKRDALERAEQALRDVGIPDPARRMRSYAHELSGGMAQRALIAASTINRPAVLVADEPTTGLDVTVQAQILDLLRQRGYDTGSSILFITHDLGIVAQYCDRVAVMLAGRLVEVGSVTSVFSSQRHPYTKTLIASADPGVRNPLLNGGPAR